MKRIAGIFRNQTLRPALWLLGAALLCAMLLALSPGASRAAADAAVNVKISGELPNYRDVSSTYVVSPDSRRVAFTSNKRSLGLYDLYVTAANGSAPPVPIDEVPGTAYYNGVAGIGWTPDSQSVLYLLPYYAQGHPFFEIWDLYDLFVAPAAGGSPVQLNGPLTEEGSVTNYALTPDGSRVVYLADEEVNDRFELYSVPVTGGTAVKLNGPLGQYGRVYPSFKISPDGGTVFFCGYAQWPILELYRAPIGGGQPVKLSDPQRDGGTVAGCRFELSADGRYVIYAVDGREVDQDPYFGLIGLPVDGGPPVFLNQAVPSTAALPLSWFAVDPAGSRVVFIAGWDGADRQQLLSVPVTGGAEVGLNEGIEAIGFPGSEWDTIGVAISPDSQRVVYRVEEEVGPNRSAYHLYSVPIGGGTPARLDVFPPDPHYLDEFSITPDSTRVTFTADEKGIVQLYTTPIAAGDPIRLSDPAAQPKGVRRTVVSPDSSRVVFLGRTKNEELFSAPITGGSNQKLNGPLVELGSVENFVVAPDSKRVIYLASQDDYWKDELFAAFGAFSGFLPLVTR
ncbi:MAG: hypothetical protein ACK2UK_01265 [Candidatus Promineifilaceae bacterium]